MTDKKLLLALFLALPGMLSAQMESVEFPADPYFRSQLLFPQHSKDLRNSRILAIGDHSRLGLSTRARFEQRENLRFSNSNPEAFSFATQSKIWFASRPTDHLGLKLTLQDARIWGGSRTPAGDTGAYGLSNSISVSPSTSDKGDRNFTDLREAFLVLSNGPWHALVGRSVISFGDQRLFGGRNWQAHGNSFDGTRLWYKDDSMHSELFIASLAESSNGPNGILSFSGADYRTNEKEAYTGGWFNSWNNGAILVDAAWFFLYKERTPEIRDSTGALVTGLNPGTVKDHKHTFDVRLTNRTKGGKPEGIFDYTLEGAIQIGDAGEREYLGSSGGSPVWGSQKKYFSWLGVASAGLQLTDSLHLGGQVIYSTGDNNRADATISTFDPMFANRHSLFPFWSIYQGETDPATTRNLIASSASVMWQFLDDWTMVLTVTDARKAQPNDAWYAASGASNNLTTENWSSSGTNPTGSVNYTELDLVLLGYPMKFVGISAGVSIIRAGDAVKALRGSDFSEWSEYTYIMVNASI